MMSPSTSGLPRLVRWAVSDACAQYVGSPGVDVQSLERLLTLALTEPWEYACQVNPHLRRIPIASKVVLEQNPQFIQHQSVDTHGRPVGLKQIEMQTMGGDVWTITTVDPQ